MLYYKRLGVRSLIYYTVLYCTVQYCIVLCTILCMRVFRILYGHGLPYISILSLCVENRSKRYFSQNLL